MLGLMYCDLQSSSPQCKFVMAKDNVMQVVHASLFGTVKFKWDSEKQVMRISLPAKDNEL